MQPDDNVEGIVNAAGLLVSKVGLNKRKNPISSNLDNGKLILKVQLNSVSEATADLYKNNFEKIVSPVEISVDKVQTSEALYDTIFRATVNQVGEDETMDVTFSGKLGDNFESSQIDDSINKAKEALKGFGHIESAVIMKTRTGHELLLRILSVPASQLEEAEKAFKESDGFSEVKKIVNNLKSKSLVKSVKKFFQARHIKFSELKIYFDKEVTKLYIELHKVSTAVNDKAVEELTSGMKLTDMAIQTK